MTFHEFSLDSGVLKFLCVALLLSTGCASWYLKGAEMAGSRPSNAEAMFTVSTCVTPQGQALPAPNTTYYLDTSTTSLYEIENANGEGARITNSWTDANGRHFFVWVGNGPGWEYIFPNDPSEAPVRRNFDAGSYQGDRSMPDVIRPVGTPSSTCTLQRSS